MEALSVLLMTHVGNGSVTLGTNLTKDTFFVTCRYDDPEKGNVVHQDKFKTKAKARRYYISQMMFLTNRELRSVV